MPHVCVLSYCATLSPQHKRRGAIDYSAEVAFEKKPAAGFFDTSDEQMRSKEIQQVCLVG